MVVFACLVGWTPTARAQVVLASTLGNTASGGFLQLDFNNHWYSQPFQTTGSLFSISSVTINMASANTVSVVLRIYTNNGSVAGTDTGITFTTPANSASLVNTTFNFSSGPALSANTPYWLVLHNSVDYSAVQLSYSTATTGTGSGFVAGAPLFSPTSGVNSYWYNQNPNTYLLFSISATSAVPEPATYAFGCGIAALGAAAYRRRKRREPVS